MHNKICTQQFLLKLFIQIQVLNHKRQVNNIDRKIKNNEHDRVLKSTFTHQQSNFYPTDQHSIKLTHLTLGIFINRNNTKKKAQESTRRNRITNEEMKVGTKAILNKTKINMINC
jgi:hypothetical protein